jgi:peptidoglycan/LPS O-acetylase OafA/YrhL
MVCHGVSARWAERGAVGVNIFFGISGFLICSRLLEEWRRSGRISLAGFYIRRTFRILPPYMTYLAVLAALAGLGVLAVNRWEWLSCLLFFRNYVTAPAPGAWWYTGHFWSLAVEEHFYLLWPTLLLLWGPRRARWGAAGLATAVAAWRTVDAHFHISARLVPGINFFMRTDTSLDGLFWGCWLALILEVPAWRERLARALSGAGWSAVVAAFLACVLFHFPLNLAGQAALIPLMLAGTVLRPDRLAGRLLESAPLRWVGRMSYSLYIWQQMFLVHEHSVPRLAWLQVWPWNVAAVFACAAASFYLIERPMIRWGHALSKRAARVAPAGPVPEKEAAPLLGV